MFIVSFKICRGMPIRISLARDTLLDTTCILFHTDKQKNLWMLEIFEKEVDLVKSLMTILVNGTSLEAIYIYIFSSSRC